jgi:hypothetical protein
MIDAVLALAQERGRTAGLYVPLAAAATASARPEISSQ